MSKQVIKRYVMSESTQKDRIESALYKIGLQGILPMYEQLATEALEKNSPPINFLEELLEIELNFKEEHRITRGLQLARFPAIKTFSGYNFSLRKGISKKEILDLVNCRFIDKKQNVIFFGASGLGKTHLSIVIGQEAVNNGYDVKFTTLDDLVDHINKQNSPEGLKRLLAAYIRPALLILDEMDMHEITSNATNSLFQILYSRYENGSIIITSNQGFSSWEKLFGTKNRTNAIIDRVLHHSHIFQLEGKSYRVKDKLQN